MGWISEYSSQEDKSARWCAYIVNIDVSIQPAATRVGGRAVTTFLLQAYAVRRYPTTRSRRYIDNRPAPSGRAGNPKSVPVVSEASRETRPIRDRNLSDLGITLLWRAVQRVNRNPPSFSHLGLGYKPIIKGEVEPAALARRRARKG
jgi:hypothetical protein